MSLNLRRRVRRDPPEEESESETSEYGSNEELLAHQNIVIPPKLELEFRFTKVDKRYALVRSEKGASVYEKKSDDAREVGELEYYGSPIYWMMRGMAGTILNPETSVALSMQRTSCQMRRASGS